MQTPILTRTIVSAVLLAFVAGCDSGPKAEAKAEAKQGAIPVTPAAPVVPASPAAPAVPVNPDAPIAKVDTPVAAAMAEDKAKPRSATPTASAVAGKIDDKVKAAEPVADKPAEPAADAGGSLAQKEGWANYTKELNRKVEQVNTACGTKLSASYDKSTYTDFDPIKDRTQSACQQAVGTLSAICASEPGKQSVAKLTKATCKFSTSGTGVSLSGSTLVVKIDPEKSAITGKAAGSYSWASAIKEVI